MMSVNCDFRCIENITAKAARAARWCGRRRAMSVVLLSVLVLISGAAGVQAASGPQPTAPPGATISGTAQHAGPQLEAGDDLTGADVTGSVVSAVFYQHFQLVLKTGTKNYTFKGNAGGLTVPGASAIIGRVFTDDLEALVRDTTAFEYQSVPGVFNINFFSADSRFLGSLIAGNVGLTTGIGGGSGYWSS